LPLAKKSKPQNISDFRPISILPSASKILEIVLKNQIEEYITSSCLISSFQSGLRKHFSTTSALIEVIDNVSTNIDNKEVSLLVLLDFSKAFDCVSHFLLLNKLKNKFKFSSSSLNFIINYLSDRFQMVELESCRSNWKPVKSGVPQGGVLSTLLFVMYVNDIESCLNPNKFHLYADDVQLITFSSRDCQNQSINDMNNALSRVSTWAHENELTLNPS
jgi:hypothetical protein